MELCSLLEERRRIGLPVRKLRLIGGWSNKPKTARSGFFRAPPTPYEEQVERDVRLTKEAEREGFARARELVEELIDERVL